MFIIVAAANKREARRQLGAYAKNIREVTVVSPANRNQTATYLGRYSVRLTKNGR